MTDLGKHPDPPYFGSYTVTDERSTYIRASFGALESSSEQRARRLHVAIRIGNHARDNTHAFAGEPMLYSAFDSSLPIEDDEYAIRSALWRNTDEAYQRAHQQLALELRPGTDGPDDFSPAKPSEYFEPPAQLAIDRPAWEKRVRELSAAFRRHPELPMGMVTFTSTTETRYYTNSEGTRYQVSEPRASLEVRIGFLTERFVARSPDRLPSDEMIRAKLEALATEASALVKAPAIDDYDGPAILEGATAGLFFHEVLGQLVEYRRDQKESLELVSRIGSPILPDIFDVYDDPTIGTLNGRELAGFYRYDDEGIPGQETSLVEHGVLKAVLTSRSTVPNTTSNGHGRNRQGLPIAQQGNLVISAARTVDGDALRRMLVDEVRRQHKPYGIVIHRLGGPAYTDSRWRLTRSFSLWPLVVFRVYPDGRQEIVRTAGIEGDRFQVLAEILAASTDVDTFNGLDDSSSSPSVLVRRIQVRPPTAPALAVTPLPPPPVQTGRR